ncbi:MAG: hypothetical protein J5800_04205 [Spirochaetales bacterium]|nr:hypothetical protein [Spirochaetales bacterium]
MLTCAITLIICCVLFGCFACKQERTDDPKTMMTDEQKAAYWTAAITDVRWAPQTDDTHDGILKDMFLPRETKTVLDAITLKPMIYFMMNEEDYLDSATIELTSEEGKIVFQTEERWDVRFSEKDEILYMTITDSTGKTVYYQQK